MGNLHIFEALQKRLLTDDGCYLRKLELKKLWNIVQNGSHNRYQKQAVFP